MRIWGPAEQAGVTSVTADRCSGSPPGENYSPQPRWPLWADALLETFPATVAMETRAAGAPLSSRTREDARKQRPSAVPRWAGRIRGTHATGVSPSGVREVRHEPSSPGLTPPSLCAPRTPVRISPGRFHATAEVTVCLPKRESLTCRARGRGLRSCLLHPGRAGGGGRQTGGVGRGPKPEDPRTPSPHPDAAAGPTPWLVFLISPDTAPSQTCPHPGTDRQTPQASGSRARDAVRETLRKRPRRRGVLSGGRCLQPWAES